MVGSGIELSGVGSGIGDAIVIEKGTSYRMTTLIESAASRLGFKTTTRGRGPHFGYEARPSFGGRTALSAYLAWAGLTIVFGEIRKEPHVIRKSVFGIVRHPIYISEILLYLGLLLLNTSLAGLAIWIIVIAFLHYISRYEEKLLLARFGNEYQQYTRDVPMYFPRLRRRSIKPSK